jgi:hypothetical protein
MLIYCDLRIFYALALIPDFWLYTFDGKLYFAYPTLKGIESRNWEKPKKER